MVGAMPSGAFSANTTCGPTTWKASSKEFCGRKRTTSPPSTRTDWGCLPVSVERFAGFIFLNPNPDAEPLADYLGEVVDLLSPYHLEEMDIVLDVREALNCNWKVVMDAFEEGYHISGIHPELLQVVMVDPTTTRYRFFDKHSVSVRAVRGGRDQVRARGTTRRHHETAGNIPVGDGVAPTLPGADRRISR